MINLENNTSNTFATTLYEYKLTDSKYCLFHFICDAYPTYEKFVVLEDKNTGTTHRYEEFELKLVDEDTITTGETTLNLLYTGFYTYYAYEVMDSQEIQSTSGLQLLEVGRMRLDGTTTTPSVYKTVNSSDVFVYKK